MSQGVEIRGASMLTRADYVAIMEKMFKGCTEPPEAPLPLSEELKQKQEWAAQVRRGPDPAIRKLSIPTVRTDEDRVFYGGGLVASPSDPGPLAPLFPQQIIPRRPPSWLRQKWVNLQ